MAEKKDLVVNDSDGGTVFIIKAQPGAKRNSIGKIHDGMLKVRVSTNPEKGKANKAIINILASKLNIPQSEIEIVKGHYARKKTILVQGIKASELLEKITSLLEA